MSAPPPIPPDIAQLPPLFSEFFGTGCLFDCEDVYSYNFPDDKKLLKLLVYVIFFIETLQTALSGADVYYWFVSGYGDIKHITSPYATPFDVPIIEAVVSSSVQFFFAFRIWLLGMKKSWCLSLIICLSSTIGSVAAFTGSILALIHRDFPNTDIQKILAMIWLSGNLMADIHIAAAMLYHLARRRKARDGLFSDHALDHYLSKIVRLTVETNVMTGTYTLRLNILPRQLKLAYSHRGNCFILTDRDISARDLAHMPVRLRFYPDLHHLTSYCLRTAILGKLYSNTFLVSLNNRISIREAAAINGVEVISPDVALALPRSTDSSDTIVTRPPAAYSARSLTDSKWHERVVAGSGEAYP
ncbi:hypothetical protein BGW80DRAFT_1469118 [Lactifluus volemus]|nr:hypothetical protein BGW80DRAFT_1469118 [Lactifluus volemus]